MEICMNDLTGDQHDIAECVGIDAYNALCNTFGGCSIYVYKPDTITRRKRDREIRADYSAGKTVHSIVATYKMSERAVREIIRDLAAARRGRTKSAPHATHGVNA